MSLNLCENASQAAFSVSIRVCLSYASVVSARVRAWRVQYLGWRAVIDAYVCLLAGDGGIGAGFVAGELWGVGLDVLTSWFWSNR